MKRVLFFILMMLLAHSAFAQTTVIVGADSTTISALQDAVLVRFQTKINAARAAQTPPLAALNKAETLIELARGCVEEIRNQHSAEDSKTYCDKWKTLTTTQKDAICTSAALNLGAGCKPCP